MCAIVIHCGLVTPCDWRHKSGSTINIGSGNGLLPTGYKLLPEPMLTNHQLSLVYLRVISQGMLKISILYTSLKLTAVVSYVSQGQTSSHLPWKFVWIWVRVRSRKCGCPVTGFCYQLIAKPVNNTAALPWPDPCLWGPWWCEAPVVQVMAWCWPGNKPLAAIMMGMIYDLRTTISYYLHH